MRCNAPQTALARSDFTVIEPTCRKLQAFWGNMCIPLNHGLRFPTAQAL
jgi:hypothetical protein